MVRRTATIIQLIAILAATLTVGSVLLRPVPAAAQTVYQTIHYPAGWEIIPAECLGDQQAGECSVNSFVQLFVNLAGIMLKVAPTLAMLMLIYGGFTWMISGGRSESVQTGKRIISSTIIGVILIIGVGWGLSFLVVSALTGDTKQASGTLFAKGPWERKWWNPGETAPGPTSSTTGCCILVLPHEPTGSPSDPTILGAHQFGCMQATPEDCQKKAAECGLPDAGDYTYVSGQSCAGQTMCQNFTVGCCVPTAAFDPKCANPDQQTGCINWCLQTTSGAANGNPNTCGSQAACAGRMLN